MKPLRVALLLASLYAGASHGDALVTHAQMTTDELALFEHHHCAPLFKHDSLNQPNFDTVSRGGLPGKVYMVGWCSRETVEPAARRKFVLAISFEDLKDPLAKCPSEISDFPRFGFPTLFALDSMPDLESLQFHFVDDGTRVNYRVPRKGRGIYSELDGSYDIFVCVRRRWAHALIPE